MAQYLQDAFPDMSGFSARNIKYMRKFAECWPDFEFVQQVVAQLLWRTNLKLINKLDSQESRLWYATKAIENEWSSTILELQIESCLMERTGKSINNFSVALPPLESDMANHIKKDTIHDVKAAPNVDIVIIVSSDHGYDINIRELKMSYQLSAINERG